MLGRPPLATHLMSNVFFDTCVYHYPGIALLFEVIDFDNLLFASEMFGAVKGIDLETGFHFDHTKRYIDKLDISEEDRQRGVRRKRPPRVSTTGFQTASNGDGWLNGLRAALLARIFTNCRLQARIIRADCVATLGIDENFLQ